MSDQCAEMGNATNELALCASSSSTNKATTGKQTIDNIMKPIREAREAEKTATGAEKTRLMDEIHSHYVEGKAKGETTKETQAISKAVQADSDVKDYIHSLSVDEFGKLRKELQTTFGGDQARMAEMEYGETKLNSLETRLNDANKMVPSLQDKISMSRSRGILSDSDLMMMKGIEDLLSLPDDALKAGKSRNTYNKLSRTLGNDVTQDIFGEEITKQIDQLNTKLSDQTYASKLMKTAPTKEELDEIDNIMSGARKMDASSLEFVSKMLDKVNKDGFKEILKTTEATNELDKGVRGASHYKATQKWSSKRKIATGIGAPLVFASVGVPTILNGWGMFGLTNAGEMSALFAQFDKDQTSDKLLENWFPTGIRKTAMDMWIKATKDYLSTMDEAYDIPLYGKWLEAMTSVGYTSALGGLGNLDTKMSELENKGLATRDESSTTGWRQTTSDEKLKLYTENPSALYKNDSKFVQENAPWTGSTGVMKGEKELDPADVMALYYMDKGKIDRDSFLKSGGSLSDLDNNTLMNAVRDYGREHDASKEETTTNEVTESTPNAIRTKEDYINSVMKKNNWDRERATEFVEGRISETQLKSKLYDRQNLTEEEAIAKLYTGDIGNARTDGSDISGGGSGGSESEQKDEVDMIAEQIRQGRSGIEESDKEKVIDKATTEGKVDIKKVKDATGDKLGISDMVDVNRAGTISGFKDYAKSMEDGAGDEEQQQKNRNDYEQMKAVDKKAAGEAMLERYGCSAS